MSPTVFEEAASRLKLALENDQLDRLQTSDFRVFIPETSSSIKPTVTTQREVLDGLLAILCSNKLSNNNQIVAATAYCKTVSHLLQELEEILIFLVDLLKEKQFQDCTIFLCHGIFQLNCWNVQSESGDILLEEIFKIVQKFCCNLTSTCYLAFKVLHSLLTKIHQLYPNGDGISKENFKAVLDIVLSNWESPLSGVRQQNSLVLNQLLLFNENYWINALAKAIDPSERKDSHLKHHCLLKLTLSELSWTMKSKYFLLTSIVQNSNALQILAEHGEDIVSGLTTSLTVPYLVSAGTDLYLTLLPSLSLQDWQHWFFKTFSSIISQVEPCLEVENIFNYWMDQTLKKFPLVFKDLIGATENSLYSFITLLKIGRKEGFCKWEDIENNRKNSGRVRTAVMHHSEKIRSQVFSLVCTSSNTTSPPSGTEYDIIEQFLKDNVNSDDSALRQNLLKAFNSFMFRMRDFILHTIKVSNDGSTRFDNNPSKLRCFAFLNRLYYILLSNLEENCNYQRKITSLEIFKIILSCFGDGKEKSDQYKRKSNKNSMSVKNTVEPFMFKFGSDKDKLAILNCLFDEDNNIRSSAATLLMSYYQLTESNKEEFEMLFRKGMVLCRDQIFYKAEAGALITQVLVTLAYKSSSQEFRNMVNNESDSFLDVLLISAEEQFSQLQDDLLKAASQGAFLYGTLQAIELITSSSSVPELSLREGQLQRLICLIEKVAEYFISVLVLKSDSSSGYAPSFGEMGMAVAAVVDRSSVKSSDVTGAVDDTVAELQLTPAQQLVLSCVWLNLKECTKLCSLLVSRQLSVVDSQRCVAVVVSVLRRCRHKGAIESAGLALYHITAHLTKSNEPALMNQPEELLEDFLQMLVGTTASTVSRRSAGLAILIHRLITGDSRPKKPLLHLCVSRLLRVVEDSDVSEHEALIDLPQSQALHFLRTLVQESSLREHMAQYTLSISLVALTNLASPLWTIRNAALQLFGALVPKLVGQKPNQEQSRGSYYLAFEELYIHARPLVEMMLKEFTAAADSNSTTSHSKLMPLLTLVTNLTLGLQSVVTDNAMKIIQQFQQCFQKLFKSKIFNVRKLSSKGHALFTTPSNLVGFIDGTVVEVMKYLDGGVCNIQSENELNGYVLSLTHLFGRFEKDKFGMKVLLEKEKGVFSQLEQLSNKLLSAQCSYFTKALVFEFKFPISFMETVALPPSITINHSLGYAYFIQKKLSSAFLTLSEKEVGDTVNICLLQKPNHDVQYFCLKALKLYSKTKKNLSTNTYNVLLNYLTEYLLLRKHNSVIEPLVLEVILTLIERMNDSNSSLSDRKQFYRPDLFTYCLNTLSHSDNLLSRNILLLPITSVLLVAHTPVDMDALSTVSKIIKARSEPGCDQDIRLSSAKSVYLLTELLKTGLLKDSECGMLVWEACINLLQDEVAEIRFELSKCISVLLRTNTKYWFEDEHITYVLNPYICLESLFILDVANKFMTLEKMMECLASETPPRSDESSQKFGISNPFDHGVKSIYAEKELIFKKKLYLLSRCLRASGVTEEDLDELLRQVDL